MDQIDGLTYHTLDTALLQLGFQKRETEKARFYEHASTGAVVAYPLRSLTEAPQRTHLSATAATLEMFGIKDQYDFYLLLLRLIPIKVAA